MGSTGKSTNNGTITKADGSVISLPEKLVYSPDTGSMNIPKAVTDFEKSNQNSNVEHLILWSDFYGKVGEHVGDSKHVSAPIFEHQIAEITSHNHPRPESDEKGWLSGTFSPKDIVAFSGYHKTDRVVGYEGIYSISKGANFNPALATDYTAFHEKLKQDGLVFSKDAKKRIDAEYNQLKKNFQKKALQLPYEAFEKEYQIFKKDWDAINRKYEAEVATQANKFAIASHNWLLANQKKYGYTYGLTRG